MGQQALNFISGQDRRQPFGALRLLKFAKLPRITVKYLSAHEHDGVERLILSRCGHASVPGEARQECPHFAGPHLARMPLDVEQDEPLHPPDVRLFRAVSEVLHPAGVRHQVEKPRLAWFWLISGTGGGLGRVKSRL